jgi:hypothetical protein
MLGIVLAAAVYSCPIVVGYAHPVGLNVYYEHEGSDGRAYLFHRVDLLFPGTHNVSVEGHPVGVEWSDGTFCGNRPELLFRDGFETGTTDRWETTS